MKEETFMSNDEYATRYERGNGRFDLMTDEQVCSLTHDDLTLLLVSLSHLQGHSLITFDLYHRLEELLQRYPECDFQLLPVYEKDHDSNE